MNLLFILFIFLNEVLLSGTVNLAQRKSKWRTVFSNKTCSTETFPCPEILNLLKKVNKCNGLIICYPSLLSNAYFSENTKLNNRFTFNETNTTRICAKCIEGKQCKGPDGVETEWSGFRVFYDEKENSLEVNLDIFGKRNTLHINGTTALDFLQALSDKNLISKIREQSNVDKEYFEEKVGGAWLEDYLGVLALNIDLGIGFVLNRDIAFGMLYRRDYPIKCRKEKVERIYFRYNQMTIKVEMGRIIKSIQVIFENPIQNLIRLLYLNVTSFVQKS
uniref:Uncharacterized protein n=1 Tax=Meloidogyne enterolobii TaxID=390850 RepID=A0A6V7UWG5_MELEN|nr:unnamed protein product [Meloidogyne enterolobii]